MFSSYIGRRVPFSLYTSHGNPGTSRSATDVVREINHIVILPCCSILEAHRIQTTMSVWSEYAYTEHPPSITPCSNSAPWHAVFVLLFLIGTLITLLYIAHLHIPCTTFYLISVVIQCMHALASYPRLPMFFNVAREKWEGPGTRLCTCITYWSILSSAVYPGNHFM